MTIETTADEQAWVEHLSNPRQAGMWELVQANHKLRQLQREVGAVFEQVHQHIWDGRDHLLANDTLEASLRLVDHAIIRLAYLAERCPEHAHEVRAIRECLRDAAGPLRQLQ